MSCVFGYGDTRIVRAVTYLPDTGLFITDFRENNALDDERCTETYFNLGEGFDMKDGIISDGEHTLFYRNNSAQAQVRLVEGSRKYNEMFKTKQILVRTGSAWVTHAFLMSDLTWEAEYGMNEIKYVVEGRQLMISLTE